MKFFFRMLIKILIISLIVLFKSSNCNELTYEFELTPNKKLPDQKCYLIV